MIMDTLKQKAFDHGLVTEKEIQQNLNLRSLDQLTQITECIDQLFSFIASKKDPDHILTEDVRLLSKLERSNKILLEGMNRNLSYICLENSYLMKRLETLKLDVDHAEIR